MKKTIEEQKEEDNYTERVKRKKNLTFFLIMLFSLLLSAVPYAVGDFFIAMILEVIIMCGQVLVVKTVLDDFYK
jgi:hypothetical protein